MIGCCGGCAPANASGSVQAAGELFAATDPNSSGRLVFDGQLSQRSGALSVPIAFTPVELVQRETVLASAKTDHAGRFHLVAVIRNGAVEIRMTDRPDVRVVLMAKWQQLRINDLELVAKE